MAEVEEIVDVPEAAAVPANWPTNGASPAEALQAQVARDLANDPLAEVCANWSQPPGSDDVPACIFCDDAYRGVVHNSGKGPDAFFYCCTCDKHFTRREADFFAGRRGVLT